MISGWYTITMKIIITAGGNTEKIDEVRMIRNTGTGRLGALVAEKLLAENDDVEILYVCDRRAATPSGDRAGKRVTVIHADDVTALEAVVRKVCSENRIDAVVHSMAVSDYRVKNVTTAMNAADAMVSVREEAHVCGHTVESENDFSQKPRSDKIDQSTRNRLAERITSAKDVRDGGKISSELDDVLVVLERAPKIIALYRSLAPNAVIMGFKLLADVDQEELIGVGYNLLKKNDCDYVLANDMKYLNSGGHRGHLIARDGSYETYDGKETIAAAIATAINSEAARLR
jgi:phosphopantothenate-cysteine ligase